MHASRAAAVPGPARRIQLRLVSTRLAIAATALLLASCASLQGKSGPGNQSTYDNGVLGNGRSIEENRKVGSPGSD